ncbi:hypothetical protein SEPCBS119000_006408 [Sporothrix epigloea]|uniref:Protein prenyltransferase n=1 Tax=Sporothrix epigloea TaxID=1892477 RepID=A0ABP0E2U9_9PEZI
MSRAIDACTAAAIRIGDPDASFRAIADILMEEPPLSTPAVHLEIEILGREYPSLPAGKYLLHDGNAVAIPKTSLLQAFAVARKLLQRYKNVPLSSVGTDDGQSLWRATAVILLADPEHLTAANTRKRLIQASLQQQTPALPAAEAASALLNRELYLVDSLLTSHLHRHNKSPTLWNHRRWLLSSLATPATRESYEEGKKQLFHGMTKVIMISAVRHPRNYYAWEHARWLVCWLHTFNAEKDESKSLVVMIRDWCYRNHTDTSGWSFLLFLLALLSSPPTAASLSPLYDETVVQVVQMVKSLRWTGEAVWVFLRTAVALQRRVRGDKMACHNFEDTVSALLDTVDITSIDYQVLQRSQKWCAVYSVGRIHATV